MKNLLLEYLIVSGHPTLPLILSELIRLINIVQDPVAINFNVPRVKGIASKSFFYHAILYWNALPPHIRTVH